MHIKRFLVHVPATIVALIFIQTLFFKFIGAAESVYIFSKIGIEPWGRYLIGSLELVASFLLVLPKLRTYGSILSLAIILPAIMFHLTTLGIVVQGDGGLLFGLAIMVAILSVIQLVFLRKSK